MTGATFRGWPPAAVAFFEGLEADNSKAYWVASKAVYDDAVRGPMLALSDAVADEFSPLKIFRPNRDMRFSADKSPYKTHIGAYGESEGGAGYYVQLSAQGLGMGVGYYQMAPDQLARYRDAVADDRTGAALVAVVADLERARISVRGEALKTAPRGFPKDHPRVRFLRHKGLYAWREHAPARWLATPAALTRVVGLWQAAAPLVAWLDGHVGPSELPPDDLERW